jgi:hypothetical protein
MAWHQENSFLLNHQWAYALFDDGHISGAALLKFRIDANHKIIWEVVDAVLD